MGRGVKEGAGNVGIEGTNMVAAWISRSTMYTYIYIYIYIYTYQKQNQSKYSCAYQGQSIVTDDIIIIRRYLLLLCR